MVLLVVLLVLLAIFVLQNTQKVEISFLGWSGNAPLAAALLIATAAGLGPRRRRRHAAHPAAAPPGQARPQGLTRAQRIGAPEIARAMTRRWISEVPSKIV